MAYRSLNQALLSLIGVIFLICSLQVLSQAQEFDDPNSYLTGEELVKELQKHYSTWKSAKGKERQREADSARFYAWRSSNLEMIDVDEIISDGRLLETEVKAPDATKTVRVDVKLKLTKEDSQAGPSWLVWRRITPERFEVWTPTKGWLFNRNCELIHTANALREGEANGRQWFGAFLPDGHWITTDMKEWGDGIIYIFNSKGQCTHKIKSGNLLHSRDFHNKALIVPWARSNKSGNSWVVRIGSEAGEGEALLEPDGTSLPAISPPSIWQRCMARQLGVRLGPLSYCGSEVESDDGTLIFTSWQPTHGPWVGNPSYDIAPSNGHNYDKPFHLGDIPSEENAFGFWPRSHATYVFNGKRTWFFNAKCEYQGWIVGERVGDSPDRKCMIFRQPDGRCVTVSPTLHVTAAQSFALPDGRRLYPLELQPDIGIGIFTSSKPEADERITTGDLLSSPNILVARWNTKADH